MKANEKSLSQIRLKYYKIPKKSKEDEPSGIKCSYCFEPDIIKIGGTFLDKNGKYHHICERCAIERYKEEGGFKTLNIAKNRRRRIFDVGYLFNEMVIDKYLSLKEIKDFESLGEKSDDIFIKAGELYNYLFSKEEKIRIEEIESQEEIEKELKKRLAIIDLKEFFLNF